MPKRSTVSPKRSIAIRARGIEMSAINLGAALEIVEGQIQAWSKWATPSLDDPEAQATPESEEADTVCDVLNDVRRAMLERAGQPCATDVYFDAAGNRREVARPGEGEMK